MATISLRGIKWPRLGMRACLALMGVGITLEVLAMLIHIVVFENLPKDGTPLLGLSYARLLGSNALFGFLGTIFLISGSLCLIRPLSLSRSVAAWGYATAFCFVCYKGLDVIYSLLAFSFQNTLGIAFGIDEVIRNLLLISSAIMLLVTMICALFDLHRTRGLLTKRNLGLDQEVQERRLLSAAIENAVESMQIMDASGTILYANSAFTCLMGYTKEEVLGRHWRILESGRHDEIFWMEIEDTVRQGKVWRGSLVNKKKNGEYITVDAVISAIKDEEDNISHYVTVKRDITKERMLEQQAQQSQKLEAIGTLAGGIAHDLNNVLAVIMGHSEISLARLEADHPVRKSMEVIMRTADRSSQLIKRLLVFSRQGVAEPGLIEPAPLVGEQMKVIRSYLPTNIDISGSIAKDIGCILGEPVELQQILFNLCTNANHAMQPEGGVLEISTDSVVINEAKTTTAGTLKPGEYVRLSVRDTGCGMDAAILERLFEPFFTTKDVGMGTGLGLSMVHGSIMHSGGAIDVASAPGKGSQFDLYWPKLEYEAPQNREEISIPDGNGRMVLVVDDMADFKDMMEMNLIVHGFKTIGFTESENALDFFKNNSDSVDIALVDYMMPGMNGTNLAECLHEINPELPIVLLSGYSCNVTEENASEYGFSAAISKPVETDRLIRTLCQCLSG